MNAMSEHERSAIYERDWNQYIAWLGRNAVAKFSGEDG
jgi:hypothetical protein